MAICVSKALSACTDRKPHQRTFIRLHSAPLTTLMVATYVPPSTCTAHRGDFFTLLGIMNKQDYARWHSCEFVLGAKTFDPSLRPPGHPEACLFSPFSPCIPLIQKNSVLNGFRVPGPTLCGSATGNLKSIESVLALPVCKSTKLRSRT